MNTIDEICRLEDAARVLVILAEECGELIQAAAKTVRVVFGDPNADPEKARENLIEEMGDVEVMLAITAHKLLNPEEQWAMCAGEAEKTKRYLERLLKQREEK